MLRMGVSNERGRVSVHSERAGAVRPLGRETSWKTRRGHARQTPARAPRFRRSWWNKPARWGRAGGTLDRRATAAPERPAAASGGPMVAEMVPRRKRSASARARIAK